MVVKVVDSHTGGEPTRCVVQGPPLQGSTIADKRNDLATRLDSLRQGIACEPRGSDVLVGAWITEPIDPTCNVGVVFFNNVGVLNMCGHGTIGLAETLRHLGTATTGDLRIETNCGPVTAHIHGDASVSFQNVPCRRLAKGVQVNLPNGQMVTGDIAWGGNWFFLCSDHRQEIALSRVRPLTDLCIQIDKALADQGVTGENGSPIDHIELTAPGPHGPNSGKNFVLCPGAAYDRSPCGTGTSAKVACLAAEGRLQPGQTWIQESVTGSTFTATYQMVEGQVLPTVTGTAYVTAESTLHFQESDPLIWGFTSEQKR